MRNLFTTLLLTLALSLAAPLSLLAQTNASRAMGWRIYKESGPCLELVSFSTDAPTNIVVEDVLQNYTLRGAAFDGTDYYLMDSEDGFLPTRFLRYNVERGRLDTICNYRLIDAEGALVVLDMAFDPVDKELYALSFNLMSSSAGDDGEVDEPLGLYRIDRATGRSERIGEENEVYLIAIAFSPQGNLYGLSMNGEVWEVNKKDFTFGDVVISTDEETPSSLQDIAFDNGRCNLYWSGFSEEGRGFFSVFQNGDNGFFNYKQLGNFPETSEIVGLYIDTAPLNRKAPSRPTNLHAEAQAGSNNVVLSWTMPSTDLDGNALSDVQGVNVYRNGVLALQSSGLVAGAERTWTDTEATGMTEYRIVPTNSYGEGRAAYTDSIFAGEDLAGRPQNLKAEAEDGSYAVQLSWDEPLVGARGGWYDDASLSYEVRRQPDNVVLADALKATSFTDNTITSPHAYHYEVTALTSAGRGLTASSETVITGGSLRPPYAENFSTDEGVRYWTVIDGDGDGYTWGQAMNYQSTDYAYMRYFPDERINPEGTANDWLISPPLALESGKHYRVSYQLRTQGALFPLNYEVTLGNAPTPEAQTTTLLTAYQETNGGTFNFDGREVLFEAAETGIFHFAFHVQNLVSCHIANVSIEEVPAVDMQILSVSAPTLGSTEEDTEFTVTLRNGGYYDYPLFTLRLEDENGQVLVSRDIEETLAVGVVREETLSWHPTTSGNLRLRVHLIADLDQDESNNYSEYLSINFQQASVWYSFEQGRSYLRTSPFFLPEKHGFAQSIYTKSHVAAPAGYISAVTYRFRTSIPREVAPFKATLYMANTTEAGFDDHNPVPLPADDFVKVFEGDVTLNVDEGSVMIMFDTPFRYEGKGMSVMTYSESDKSGEYIDWIGYYRSTDDVMHTLYYGGNSFYDFTQELVPSPELPHASFFWSETSGISEPQQQTLPANLYDLQGRRLNAPRIKGVYLRGGKKVLIP